MNSESRSIRRIGLVALVGSALLAAALSSLLLAQAPAEPKKPAAPAAAIQVPMGACPASFVELFKISQEQKKGLMFYLGDQTIGGVVVKAAGDGTVEVRNQEYGRILIKLEEVSAVAMN